MWSFFWKVILLWLYHPVRSSSMPDPPEEKEQCLFGNIWSFQISHFQVCKSFLELKNAKVKKKLFVHVLCAYVNKLGLHGWLHLYQIKINCAVYFLPIPIYLIAAEYLKYWLILPICTNMHMSLSYQYGVLVLVLVLNIYWVDR